MIQEILVVEGKKDVQAVQRAVEADCIITYGYSIPPRVIEQIRKAQRQRGVIILTDPDYAGEQIRRRINKIIPGCKHAFIAMEDAMTEDDIGVERASPKAIVEALGKVRTELISNHSEFDLADLTDWGLVGQSGAAEKRNQIGKILGIGYANAKQWLRRLNMFGVTREEFSQAIEKLSINKDAESRELR